MRTLANLINQLVDEFSTTPSEGQKAIPSAGLMEESEVRMMIQTHVNYVVGKGKYVEFWQGQGNEGGYAEFLDKFPMNYAFLQELCNSLATDIREITYSIQIKICEIFKQEQQSQDLKLQVTPSGFMDIFRHAQQGHESDFPEPTNNLRIVDNSYSLDELTTATIENVEITEPALSPLGEKAKLALGSICEKSWKGYGKKVESLSITHILHKRISDLLYIVTRDTIEYEEKISSISDEKTVAILMKMREARRKNGGHFYLSHNFINDEDLAHIISTLDLEEIDKLAISCLKYK